MKSVATFGYNSIFFVDKIEELSNKFEEKAFKNEIK